MSAAIPPSPASALSLVRSHPVRLIPIDRIQIGHDVVEDRVFLSKYIAFLTGKAPTHETRLSLNSIRRGFWKHSPTGWNLVEDPVATRSLKETMSVIRLDSRPVLHLYENPNASDDKRFVCPDDVTIHAAYEALGISKVPVALMGRPRNLEESCLSLRCFPRHKNDFVALLDGLVSVTHDKVPSVLGGQKPTSAIVLSRLHLVLIETKEALKLFHEPGATTFHYHHTLYSFLLRAEDYIQAMGAILDMGKPLAAAGLLRSLYELLLVFYVDWLAPGHTFKYLQMASVVSEKSWEAMCEKWRKADLAAGTSTVNAKNIKDAHMRAFRLGCVVAERARISPLGEQFHRDIYRFLSDIVHHDFSMTARYAHTLDHGDDAVDQKDFVDTILHLSDVLVAALVTRIRADIGTAPQESPTVDS